LVTVRFVEREVAREAAACLFDVGSSLVEREGERTQFAFDCLGFGALLGCGLCEFGVGSENTGAAQEQERAFVWVQLLDLDRAR
jgi:hypothetical protein